MTTTNNRSEFYLEIRDGLVGCFGEIRTAKIEKWIKTEREERSSTITLRVADQALLEICGWFDEEPHRVLEHCFIGEWADAGEFYRERAELSLLDKGMSLEEAKEWAATIDPEKYQNKPSSWVDPRGKRVSNKDLYFCLYGKYWFYRHY